MALCHNDHGLALSFLALIRGLTTGRLVGLHKYVDDTTLSEVLEPKSHNSNMNVLRYTKIKQLKTAGLPSEYCVPVWQALYDTIRYSRFTCAQKLTRWPA